MKRYVPIFKKRMSSAPDSEAEFFILHADFAFHDEMEARMAGVIDFIFLALYDVKFVRVEHIDLHKCPHVEGKLEVPNGFYRVAIISGAEFDKLMEKHNAKKNSAQ